MLQQPAPPDTTPTVRGQAISVVKKPHTTAHARIPVWPYGIVSALLTFALLASTLLFKNWRAHQAELVQIARDRSEIEQRYERTERDLYEKLAIALQIAGSKNNCTTVPTRPKPITPPHTPTTAVRVHKLRRTETILGLGYRLCGITVGSTRAEQAFLRSVVELNQSGVVWGAKKRFIHSISDLDIVHENEIWRFPNTCNERLHNTVSQPSSRE